MTRRMHQGMALIGMLALCAAPAFSQQTGNGNGNANGNGNGNGTTAAQPTNNQPNTTQTTLGTLQAGLVNLNAQNIAAVVQDLVDVNNIQVNGNTINLLNGNNVALSLVNVQNVLNNSDIDVLNKALYNNNTASFNQILLSVLVNDILTKVNVLNNSPILNNNQIPIIVGALNGVLYYVSAPVAATTQPAAAQPATTAGQ